MQALDPRLLRVSVDINGKVFSFQDLNITASGTRYANTLQNDCIVTIYNMDRAVQDLILTETSPYILNPTPKLVVVEAGRQSYGYVEIYRGNVVNSGLTQPPDTGVTLKCLTGNYLKGNILARSYNGPVDPQTIAQGISNDANLALNYQATNKTLQNYGYSGDAYKETAYLAESGGLNVFIDNKLLIVKDAAVALTGSNRLLDLDTGMIGIPEFTEQGIRVKFLIDNQTTLGGGLTIRSKLYPATNGTYIIYKLSFELANRDTPFYFIAEAARIPSS